MGNTDIPAREAHDEAEELLPWYATGQLDEQDRVQVEAHLTRCSACQEQLLIERRFVQEFRTADPLVESGWWRLRSRIDSPRTQRRREPQGAVMDIWAILKRPAVASLATAQLAIVLVAAGLLASWSSPTYHALGSAPAPASANVIVMFRPEAKIGEVNAALKVTGASIVEGPTDANAYLLHVGPKQRNAAVSRLQSLHDIQLAQPIDGMAR